jgi:threonine dehydrogenase-like Zn-dependent dehydrogenase
MRAIAALTGSVEPEFVDLPSPPPPGRGEVLCRTLELGVCGTDREILASAQPLVPAGQPFLVLGHECLARVEQVGPEAEPLAAGDLVVPVVRRAIDGPVERVDMLPFGTYTERGIVREHGFSAPYWLDRPRHLFRIDPALADVAVLAEPLAVSEKGANEALAIQRGRLGAEMWTAAAPPRVLVTGMGPIGFAAVIACVARSWPVTMYGRDPHDSFRAQLAVSFGAKYISQFPDAREVTDVQGPTDVQQHGYDLVLECTGADDVMLASAAVLDSCGVLVWLGSSRVPRPRQHNVAQLMRYGVVRNHVHVGCVNAAPRDFRDALAHLAQLKRSHAAPLAQLITDRVAPPESLWHYTHRRPQGVKTVLVFE